jgi:hypothetical protein
MTELELENLKYPLGRHVTVPSYDAAAVARNIREIETFPSVISETVSRVSEVQLDKRYRPDGWSVRQVVHHLSDSHIHSYIRFKWAQTEDRPLIKAYDEERWAELADSRVGGIAPSLRVLEAVHYKWAAFLNSVDSYAWHCRHHLAHIVNALGT